VECWGWIIFRLQRSKKFASNSTYFQKQWRYGYAEDDFAINFIPSRSSEQSSSGTFRNDRCSPRIQPTGCFGEGPIESVFKQNIPRFKTPNQVYTYLYLFPDFIQIGLTIFISIFVRYIWGYRYYCILVNHLFFQLSVLSQEKKLAFALPEEL
jgi:hypothetical protein